MLELQISGKENAFHSEGGQTAVWDQASCRIPFLNSEHSAVVDALNRLSSR